MELFELPLLGSGDLNLKTCAFKFLIVLLLCYNILVYFNCSSLPIANRRYILLNINIEKLEIKALQLIYSIYSWYCQGKPSSIIFLNISIWFGNINRKNCFLFLSSLNMDFHGLKKKKKHSFTFTFSYIVWIQPALLLSSFV